MSLPPDPNTTSKLLDAFVARVGWVPRGDSFPGQFLPRRPSKNDAGTTCSPTELTIRLNNFWCIIRWDAVLARWTVYLRGDEHGDYLATILELANEEPWLELRPLLWHATMRLIELQPYLRLSKPTTPKARTTESNAGTGGASALPIEHTATGTRVGVATVRDDVINEAIESYAKSKKRRR